MASGALAQGQPRPRTTVVVQAPAPAPAATAKPALAVPGEPVLRKPATLALRDSTNPAKPPPGSLAALVLAQSDFKGALPLLKGLNPPSASAQAAQCRAQCGEARYVCAVRDAGDCDTVWGQCEVRCSGAAYTRTPDLAVGAAKPILR